MKKTKEQRKELRKELRKKIKDTYKENALELLLMAFFLAIFVWLNGSKILESAWEVFGSNVIGSGVIQSSEETQIQEETEASAEKNSEEESSEEKSSKEEESEEDTGENSGENAAEENAAEENAEEGASGENQEEDAEKLSEMAAIRYLAGLPEGFCYPMTIPDGYMDPFAAAEDAADAGSQENAAEETAAGKAETADGAEAADKTGTSDKTETADETANGTGITDGTETAETETAENQEEAEQKETDGAEAAEETETGGTKTWTEVIVGALKKTEEETEEETQAQTEADGKTAQALEEYWNSLPSVFYDMRQVWTLHHYHPVFLQEEEAASDGEASDGERNTSLTDLQTRLEEQLSTYDGEWSVYVKRLSDEASFVIHDVPMKSASVMKLFVMGAVYQAIDDGELQRTDEVVMLLGNMISASDNDSANQLLYLLGNSDYQAGIQKVNAFIQSYGFSENTIEYNGFNAEQTLFDATHSNQVTAVDCGKILEYIYRRRLVNRTVSNEAEQMLLNQTTRYKIPAGVPEGVLVGNKTGEMDTTENDAAIVYSPACDYIVVVLSGGWYSKDETIARIAALSRQIYEFMNSEG